MPGKLTDVTDANFQSDVLDSDSPVLVDFWAPCGPCRVVHPVLEEMDAERDDLKIVSIDVDQNQQTAARYEVLSIPTMILFKDGEEAKRIIGAMPKARIEADPSWSSPRSGEDHTASSPRSGEDRGCRSAEPLDQPGAELRDRPDLGLCQIERAAGRQLRIRDRDHLHPGGVRGEDAVARVLDRDAALGRRFEAPRGLEEDVRRGLAVRDLLG